MVMHRAVSSCTAVFTNMSTVIQAVKQATLTHPSAIKFVDRRNDRFLQFIFSLPQDNQKHVAIVVMLFHLDKK